LRRADGRLQATYNGHPLYFYIHDNEPGEVLCQNVEEFGGKWYVVKRNGAPVL
jgi:predicted lipoprotein with Yx(FWY)xxD motif